MKVYKITIFLYLAFAAFFLYNAYGQFQSGEGNYWVSIGLAAMAIFLFFFRQRNIKKIEERNKNQQ